MGLGFDLRIRDKGDTDVTADQLMDPSIRSIASADPNVWRRPNWIECPNELLRCGINPLDLAKDSKLLAKGAPQNEDFHDLAQICITIERSNLIALVEPV